MSQTMVYSKVQNKQTAIKFLYLFIASYILKVEVCDYLDIKNIEIFIQY